MILIVAPLREAEAALRRERPSHVVSLRSPGAEDLPPGAAEGALRLVFHDIAEPRPGFVPPSEADVDRLLAYGRGWTGGRPMLLQCQAGVSRSPAAAFILACDRGGPGHERRLAEALRRVAPFASPNPRLIVLADARLGRGGVMVEAARAIGRGQETDWGRSFRWDLAAVGAPAAPA